MLKSVGSVKQKGKEDGPGKEKEKTQNVTMEEEEDEEEKDDEDADPNYDPDKDPENEFIDDESIIPEDEDVMEVDKHSHAINFKEASEYVVWIRDNFGRARGSIESGGGECAKRSYIKFVEFAKGWAS